MPSQLALLGAQPSKPARFAPLFTERFSTGLWTQRSPLRDGASTRMESKYYGTRGDSFIDGQNIEISNKLTVVRRPGNSIYNSATYGTVLAFYEFRLFNTNTEEIKVMVDTATALYNGTGPSGQELIWAKPSGAGQTFMQYVANVLYFGNGVNQKKWIQNPQGWQASHNYTVDGLQTFIIDPNGNIQQLTQTVIPVTNIAITDDMLTVTYDQNVTSILSAGLNLRFKDLTAATFLNDETDQTITISAVSGSTITASYIHDDYASTPDTGSCIVIEGGTPLSGSVEPTWNTTLMGLTTDNTASWTNRGTTIENWGIEGPGTQTITVDVATNTNSWKPNTYYSRITGIIDSNGALQEITTTGVSGSSAPTWSTTLGGTTSDGTVTWTLTKKSTDLTWQPATTYSVGDLVVATPAGSVASVFELQSFRAAQLDSTVDMYLYTVPHTGAVGAFQFPYPLSTGSADASVTGGTSLSIDADSYVSTRPAVWSQYDTAGNFTGVTIPFPAYSTDYNLVIESAFVIHQPGNYTVQIIHKDGMVWGVGNGATYVSGPTNDPFSYTQTAVNGYPIMGGTNQSGSNTDTFVINFPTAGTYPVEFDYAFWYHSGQTFKVLINGIVPTVGAGGSTRISGNTEPTWVPFTTAYAPSYATCNENNGLLVWANIGPVTDFAWAAKTTFQANITTIVDNNGCTEEPFEAGVTTTTAPTFTQKLNGLTSDNPNLTWINTGRATVTPAGSLATYNGGWQYCISLVNTLTDTVSNAGFVTEATGSFLGASGVHLSGGIPAASAIDSQVDYVAIFRTKDGGASYYLIPGEDNQNTVYTVSLAEYLANGYEDTTPDTKLNIFFSPALALENSPPPTGFINLTYHLNRVFGSVGNVVQWSSGPDAPIGNGNEGFAPLNSATFPSLVKRIVPTSIGALVFTVSDIYLIAGKGTDSSPLYPIPYVPGVGILSYNALAVNGTTIHMFTTDNQFVALDPNAGVQQIGFPIGDQFESWDPAQVYVTWHVAGSKDQAVYVSNGSTGWYRLMTTPAPETGLTWCPFAEIQGGCKAVQSVEVSPGVNKLLVGPVTSGPILKRDLTVWTDNGTPYTAFGTIGSIVLAQPGQIAECVFITTDSMARGTRPTLSVLLDEVSGDFEDLPVYTADPTQLEPSSSLYAQRFYFSQTQEPALCRHLQMKFSWPAEDANNELLTLTLYGGFASEL